MSEGKVLLVDDEEQFAHMLAKKIRSRGYEVSTADNGPEAIKKAHNEEYDAIVLDMMMPEMDGIETLKNLRAENPNLQIILLTGHASLDKGVEAVKLGALDYLTKPADIEQLMEKVHEAQDKTRLLMEKNAEQRMKDLLKSKGW